MSRIDQCRRCGKNVVSPSGQGDGAYPVAPMCECPENQPNPADYPRREGIEVPR
jgi:hypothetical protein